MVEQGYCERVFTKSLSMIATRMRYKDIDPDLDYRGLKKAVQLLFKANILYPVYYSNASGFPLSATQVDKKYKVIFLDIGLVQAAGKIDPEILLQENILLINKGSLAEQYVAQHLLVEGASYTNTDLFYWKRDAASSKAEVDYIIAVNDKIVPLEVKSGVSGRLKSLHIFMQEKKINLGIKLSTAEFDSSCEIWSVPLYMVEQLPRLISSLEK